MQIEVSMDSSQYRTWKGISKTREECKDCKLNIKGLERRLSEADFEIMRLEGAS